MVRGIPITESIDEVLGQHYVDRIGWELGDEGEGERGEKKRSKGKVKAL